MLRDLMHRLNLMSIVIFLAVSSIAGMWLSGQEVDRVEQLFGKPNLVAWCIVPFDAMQRTPQQAHRCWSTWASNSSPMIGETKTFRNLKRKSKSSRNTTSN